MLDGFKEVAFSTYVELLYNIPVYTIEKEWNVVSVVIDGETVCKRFIAPAGKNDRCFIKNDYLKLLDNGK